MSIRTLTRSVLRSIGGVPLLHEFNATRKEYGPDDRGETRRNFVRDALRKAQKGRARA